MKSATAVLTADPVTAEKGSEMIEAAFSPKAFPKPIDVHSRTGLGRGPGPELVLGGWARA